MADYVLEVEARLKDYMSDNFEKINNNFNKITENVKRKNKEQQESFESLGSAVSKFKNLIFGIAALGGLKSFFEDSIKGANEEAVSINKLTNSLGKYSQKLVELSSEMQQNTLFTDDQILSAENLLSAFIKNEDEISNMIPVVADLSTKLGVDLNSAAQMVNRAYLTNSDTFGRYKMNIQGVSGSAERLKSIQTELNKVVGGSAKAAAEAGIGPLQKMANSFSDIKDSVGVQLIPTLNEFANVLMNNREIIEKTVLLISNSFVAAYRILAGIINFLSSGVTNLISMFSGLSASILNLVLVINNALPKKLLPDSWSESIKNASKNLNEFKKTIGTTSTDLMEASLASFSKIKDAYKTKEMVISQPTSGKPTPLSIGGTDSDLKMTEQKLTEQRDAHVKTYRIYQEGIARLESLKPKLTVLRESLLLGKTPDGVEKEKILFDEELSALNESYNQKILLAQNNKAILLNLENEYLMSKEILEIEHNNKIMAMEDATRKAKYEKQKQANDDGRRLVLQNIMTVTSGNKTLAGIYKAAAIAQATMDTYAAAMAASKSAATVPFVGWSLAPVIMATTIAAGIANVAKIASTKFQHGGIVGGNSFNGDKVPALLNSGEGVFTPSQAMNILQNIGNTGRRVSNNNINLTLNVGDNSRSVNNSQQLSTGDIGNLLVDAHRSGSLDKFLNRIGVKN